MHCMPAPADVSPTRRATPPTLPPDRVWRQVEAAVALTFAVPLAEIRASTRCGVDAAFARQVAMYMARVVFDMRLSAIGRLCGRDHKTVAYACRVVEQRRDDPDIDRMLHVLKDLCLDLVDALPQTPRVRA